MTRFPVVRLKNLFISAVAVLNFCGPLVAASAASEADIQAWLALWQKREGLEQRDIRLRVVRQSEMPPNSIGDVEWWETPGEAHIRVVCADDLETVYGNTSAFARYEVERTVIHELTHLVLAGLYDDGDGRGAAWLSRNPASDNHMEAITDNLAVMLLRRRIPGGVPIARYIARQINGGPWKPSADVRQRVMLQVVRAMNAASEDDVRVLFARR